MKDLKCIALLAILSSCLPVNLLAAKTKEWWETTLMYQIYPRSFKDTNKDGIGDLEGIYQKLDYIKGIGVDTIWIQPFYKSPMADLGYDVLDFKTVDPMFGNMDDIKKLIKAIHNKGMKILLDVVPNHVSDESEWFQKSVNREEPYSEFFIWKDPKIDPKTGQKTYPNNWLSIFGGTAWEWHDKRKQYYYKQFSKKQPDLNYHNPKVHEAMKDVLRFWLDMDVDGFRVDAIKHVVEDKRYLDEPYISPEFEGSGKWETQDHIYTIDQDGSYELMHEWRELIDEYKKKDNRTRILCSEAYSTVAQLQRYFGNETYKSVHIPFYFDLVYLEFFSSAKDLDTVIHSWVDPLPPNGISNWVLSNHDHPRLASRMPQCTDVMNTVQLLLPGVACVYYGDEIGMDDNLVRNDQSKDPNNGGGTFTGKRDGERTPMQWDTSMNAGFTDNKFPWLPINPNYWYINVEKQEKDPYSHLSIFKQLTKLRKTPVIQDGDLKTCVLSDWVHVFSRNLEGHQPIIVMTNLGTESESVCAHECIPSLNNALTVSIASKNSGYAVGDRFLVANVGNSFCSVLRPKSALVLTAGHSGSAGTILSQSFAILSVTLCISLSRLFL